MKDQLNVRLDPKLVERVKSRAKAEKRTLGALVGIALGEWLEGASRQARDEEMALGYFTAQNANVDLMQQVQALTERLERLEQQRGEDIRTEGPKQKPRAKAAPAAKPSTIVSAAGCDTPDGAIPTAALADLLGIKRGALNARIGRAGGAAPGLVEGWSCIGTAVPKRGGPAQALWQQG
jgi:hypothetical protein